MNLRFLQPITFLINLSGVILGVVWFGWWALVPCLLCWIELHRNGMVV